MIWAGFYTFTTTDTFVGVVHLLRFSRDAFRVVAPDAGEWAAFKKDGDADAGAIVDGVAFDVEDQWLLHDNIIPSILATKTPRTPRKSKALTERRRDGEKNSSKSF